MIDITTWISNFEENLERTFENRVYFLGIQGSYARGEARSNSDIDIVVILDKLDATDIQKYNSLLDTLPNRNLICGFISGKKEILNWEVSDLFQFYYDTKPIKGSLDFLLSLIDADAIGRAIKIAACNIYHSCVHNMLHEKSDDILKTLYKSASFVLFAIAFQQKGAYTKGESELLKSLSQEDAIILNNFLTLKRGDRTDFGEMSEALFEWSKKLIVKAKI